MTTERMSSEVACALLHELAALNLKIGEAKQTHDLDQFNWIDQEKRIIEVLLTELLGRPPLDSEIQAATAM